MHFSVLSVKYQICNNPHRFAEPPERGHEGLVIMGENGLRFLEVLSVAFRIAKW